MELILTDGKVLEELAREDKTLWEKIRDWVMEIIGQIRRSFESLSGASKTAKVLAETMETFDEIERLFTEGVKEAGERTRTAGTTSETGGGKRYSFAGENAATANVETLSEARRRIEAGEDSETVRQETGWFQGYDGKWRFEIDDSGATLIENPNLEVREDDGDVYRVGKLGDIFEHSELYEAYPELMDYTIIIQKTEAGVEGTTFNKGKQIVLSQELFKRYTKEYYDYLNGGRKNEIAQIESTSEYREYNNLYSDEVMDEMDPQEWLKAEKEARDKFYSTELGKRYYQLMWGKVDIHKYELGWSKEAKAVLLHEIQHAIQGIEGFALGSSVYHWHRKLKNGYKSNKSAGDLYDSTAGEIEARDVSKRVSMTEEQRKNTRPDIDREDVVFAGDGSVSYDVATDSNGHRVVVLYEDILKGASGKGHQIVANQIGQHIGDYYTIFESGQKVYIGQDLPGEYTQSDYTQNLLKYNRKTLKVKNNASQNFKEIIEIATDRKWEKTKHNHNKDAKYGFYRYISRVAVPVFDSKKNVVSANIYSVEVLIRNASDRKKYLYDIVNIKKENSSTLSSSWIAKMDRIISSSHSSSITHPEDSVNTFDKNSSDNLYSLGEATEGGETPDVSENRDLTDRKLLGMALEGAVQNEDEWKIVKSYREQASMLETVREKRDGYAKEANALERQIKSLRERMNEEGDLNGFIRKAMDEAIGKEKVKAARSMKAIDRAAKAIYFNISSSVASSMTVTPSSLALVSLEPAASPATT